MASSKVLASSSPANQDLQRYQTLVHTVSLSDHNNGLISMNMDDILKNIYEDPRQASANLSAISSGGGKVVDEGWKEIVDGSGGGDPEMTLEDFLTKAGAVREEEVVKLQPVSASAVVSEYSGVVDPVICASGGAGAVVGGSFQGLQQQHMQFRSAIGTNAGSSGGGGRGKRKVVVEDPPVDKATQQKQRRMIKNRESAARSRERKQAYTVELESLVTQLEEEHARLQKEVDDLNKERLKQLMENLVPVVEQRRPQKVLRRTNSM